MRGERERRRRPRVWPWIVGIALVLVVSVLVLGSGTKACIVSPGSTSIDDTQCTDLRPTVGQPLSTIILVASVLIVAALVVGAVRAVRSRRG